MFFKRQKQARNTRINLDCRRAFIFTGSHIDIVSMQDLLDYYNVRYSIVSAYYEVDLVESTTVLLQDSKAISYMCEHGDCYRGTHYYIVLPKGKQITQKLQLPKNISIINYTEETITRLLDLKSETSAS